MDLKKQAEQLVKKMTLEEKISLLSGANMWNTKSVERLGVPSVMVSDGPHGLRKQEAEGDNLGIGASVPAVCFPTASALACSFDKSLVYEIGTALGEACQAEHVDVLLGPGMNMKRSPLCGRNFEYYSEDPIVSGEMGASFIRGVESTGTGTSLKHFAVNNQERRRQSISALVDERALHETYLKAFEIAVKEGKPRTVMCSYNRVNGVYSSENPLLLTEILREKWGYDGIVVSDWGAVHDRALGVAAGLELEMPGNGGYNDRKVLATVKEGRLSERAVTLAAERMTEFALKCAANRTGANSYDKEAQHALAVATSERCAVLLKNDHQLLPGNKDAKTAVIGAFAEKPRYQGAGSSKINSVKVDSPLEQLQAAGILVDYAPGYRLSVPKSEPEEATKKREDRLVDEAVKVAKDKDIVYLFAGLTDGYESEGFDRTSMALPEDQNRVIAAVAEANPNTVVILMGGAPMELPWEEKVNSILLMYLGGEGVGTAATNLLLGKAVPSGKLAETWPFRTEDNPSYGNFPGNIQNVEYRESIYTGYKYYDTADVPVRYPFGYGLSYTEFQYESPELKQSSCHFGETVELQVNVTNTGAREGAATVLVFGTGPNNVVFHPKRELVAFTKVYLQAGESKTMVLPVDTKRLGYYNTEIGDFYAAPGTYGLLIGDCLDNLPLSLNLELTGEEQPQPDLHAEAPAYYAPKAGTFNTLPVSQFEALLKAKVPYVPDRYERPYTEENSIEDMQHTAIGKVLLGVVKVLAAQMEAAEPGQEGMMGSMMREMPLYGLTASEPDMLPEFLMLGIVDFANGKYLTGVKRIVKGFTS